MTIKQQVMVCVAVIVGALMFALLCGAIMTAAPGFFPLLLVAAVFWAGDLPVFDLDSELSKLLEEA